MAVRIRTKYAGEVLDLLLVRATTDNDLVTGGHIRIQPNVSKRFTIPRMKTGKMLQKRKEMPDWRKDAKGDYDIDEKYLRPKDIMAFTKFNPRTFESFWLPFQPDGELVFRKLPTHVQNQMLAEMAKVVNMELGDHYINGKYGRKEGQFFNGILTRIRMDKDVIRIENPANITEKNVLDVLKKVKAAIPKAVRKHKDLKIFMSQRDYDAYDWVITEKPYKGADYTNMNAKMFKGIPIAVLADWPEDVIVATYSSMNIDSNFWAGVSLKNDPNVIQIDKLEPAGELYFFKLLLKVDTNIVFGEDIVLYDPTKTDLPNPDDEDEDDDDEDDDNGDGGDGGDGGNGSGEGGNG